MLYFICECLALATLGIKRLIAWHEDYAGLVILAILILMFVAAIMIGAALYSQ